MSTSPPVDALPSGALEALQTTLAAEHAAVHVLAVLAAQAAAAGSSPQPAGVGARQLLHEVRRDLLVDQVRAREREPVAAAAAYELPALGTTELVLAAARLVEERCLQAYGSLVAAVPPGPLREWAVDALVESAGATLAWGGAPDAFPGAPEL